jgi:hypothetical protein
VSTRRRTWWLALAVMVAFVAAGLAAQGSKTITAAGNRGVKVITSADMKPTMRFLGAKEFRGRPAPSVELDIASRYIALEAERIGLKPLMPNGSYFQDLPVEVTTMSSARSSLRVFGPTGELSLSFPQAFATSIRSGGEWTAMGGLVFAGSALNGAEPKWDDAIDLRGRFVVLLEFAPPPGTTAPSSGTTPAASSAAARTRLLREKGAIGTVTVISREREDNLAKQGLTFDVTERLRWLDVDTVNPAPPPAPRPAGSPAPAAAAPAAPFYTIEVRHDAAAAMLGVTADQLSGYFAAIAANQPVPPRALPDRSIDVSVLFDQKKRTTSNVVAYLPGSDPVLKDEYVVIGSHHDHLNVREGRVFPGADDNASGAVAMLAIAKAMMVERPKRSVIFVWHTAEERGLVGAYYFVQHCPVPVEKITANLNLDMITRNDPNAIYLIGSNKISSEFDKSFKDVNAASVKLTLDYKYEDPGEPNRFFFRSDHYPYMRYGIPGVWIFCGTTPDYHTERDLEERVDYAKMEKVTRLTYLVAMDVGNRPALLPLDLHPEIKTRGAHNMKVVWQRPAQAR